MEALNDLKNNKKRQAQVRREGGWERGKTISFMSILIDPRTCLLQLQDQERVLRIKKVVGRLCSGTQRGDNALHITLSDLREADEVYSASVDHAVELM